MAYYRKAENSADKVMKIHIHFIFQMDGPGQSDKPFFPSKWQLHMATKQRITKKYTPKEKKKLTSFM